MNDANVIIEGSEKFQRFLLGRTIINDEYFEVGIRLRAGALESLTEVRVGVVSGKNDADERRAHWAPLPVRSQHSQISPQSVCVTIDRKPASASSAFSSSRRCSMKCSASEK